jgi:hypothetical protein
MHLIRLVVSWTFIILCIHSSINADKDLSSTFQRLASFYCYVDDYPAWLEQQSNLEYILRFSQFFYIDTNLIKQALEQYSSQYQCLKTLEQHPIFSQNS